jgi:hypothetical protein
MKTTSPRKANGRPVLLDVPAALTVAGRRLAGRDREEGAGCAWTRP